jgi:thiol-disulfide isomerase/thioredoxin
MNQFFTGCLFFLILGTCAPREENTHVFKTGRWRAVIEIQGQDLPFNFEVTDDEQGGFDVYLINADERLLLDEVSITPDSVDIGLHVFDANIKARIAGDSLHGLFIKNYEKDYKLPFEAVYGQEHRFEKVGSANRPHDFSGKYAVTFVHESDTTQAVGLFEQDGEKVTGTFLTPTGDYRYLAGNVTDSLMQLSTFDGNYLYLFRAIRHKNGTLSGEYFSGKTWKETWIAHKDEDATLPDAETMTYLKKGYDRIDFNFPDVNGKPVSLQDEKYKNKVVILQLGGTWCPNCMDETKFLSPWYNENKDRGVEIIGLAYERKDDFRYASERVKKMVAKWDVKYDYLIAGTNDKEKAGKTLPMLNAVVAFPTTIFIGKDGKVKKIHTGFNGPGTGLYYDQFIERFNETVNGLLTENVTAEK